MLKIEDLEPIYFPRKTDIDKNLFYPVFQRATTCSVMMGYFTSGSLSELASSLTHFLRTDDAKIRMVVSPHLSKDDLAAVKGAIDKDKNLLPLLFPDFFLTEEGIKKNAKLALSYLIVSGKLELKIALMEDGLFHTKTWIFDTDCGRVAIHGSANSTHSGLKGNVEQLRVDRDCTYSDESRKAIDALQAYFDEIWSDQDPDVKTCELNKVSIDALEDFLEESGPVDISKRKKIITDLEGVIQGESIMDKSSLKVPEWLKYDEGDFKHQGKAIRAWVKNDRKGVLSIATGGGKTLTSLTAATLTQSTCEALFLVVAVPNKVLLSQWRDEVGLFDVDPIVSLGMPFDEIVFEVKNALRKLSKRRSKCEVLVVTHELLKRERLARVIDKARKDVKTMLIGDEVHNLGSEGFKENAPACFDYLIGLSATVERQFDEEGTAFLFNYFGPIVFEFSVEDAIGNCLVPYEYHPHEVHLLEDELDDLKDLNFQIKKLGFASELSDGDPMKDKLEKLRLARRRIIESAVSKAYALKKVLPKRSELKRALIFCTDKKPQQLEVVNEFLHSEGILFHQVTQEETKNKKKLAKIIESFSDDEIRVLTSKRVLDEGFNVPQTETAFILASSTVERQWVQRLGRVLRKSSKTGKTKAIIHDFIVMPDDEASDSDMRSVIQGELNRVRYFSRLSMNGLTSQSSGEIVDKLVDLLGD